MSTDIVSKNLYELLGNDHDEDSDKEPEPPVKAVEKSLPRTTKRNAPDVAPAKAAAATAGRGAGRGNFSGNDGAFRDRQAGSANNRSKPTDDGVRVDRHPRNAGEGRGRGRGGRGGPRRDDRHSHQVGGDSEKQAAHGWGANEGNAELADEEAGKEIASAEQKEALAADGTTAVDADGNEIQPEEEEKHISYNEYLAQLAEKKAALAAGIPEARKPNEGAKQDKKWANAKPLEKDDEEEFIAGSGGKAKRERERKAKQTLEIDQRFVEQPERGGRGGRGGRGPREGGRGGRGDGGFRGGRGDGPFRGRGDGPRGGRGGPRGDGSFRGGRGAPRGGAAPVKVDDPQEFPGLG